LADLGIENKCVAVDCSRNGGTGVRVEVETDGTVAAGGYGRIVVDAAGVNNVSVTGIVPEGFNAAPKAGVGADRVELAVGDRPGHTGPCGQVETGSTENADVV
jgi:hypothetical protein